MAGRVERLCACPGRSAAEWLGARMTTPWSLCSGITPLDSGLRALGAADAIRAGRGAFARSRPGFRPAQPLPNSSFAPLPSPNPLPARARPTLRTVARLQP